MARFRMDNTEGYSATDLAELNRRFDAETSGLGDPNDSNDPAAALSHLDHIAETVLRNFDNETLGAKSA